MTKKEPQIYLKTADDLEPKPSDFVGDLGSYRFIKTEDQSLTLWSSFFDETFHNLSGAIQETFYTYLEATDVKRMCEFAHSPFVILEVGFGMGLGYYSLDQYLKILLSKGNDEAGQQSFQLRFVSFEIDQQMFEHIKTLGANTPEILPPIDQWKNDTAESSYSIKKQISYKNWTIFFEGIILIGDGRKVLQKSGYLQKHFPFHAIFQDPFSPKKNPDLWTVEWFNSLKELSQDNVILSTYSSSTSIRKSLLESGWLLHNQKGFGHKKAMTKASLTESILGPSDPEVLRKLSLSLNHPIFDRDIKEFLQKRNGCYQTD